MPRLFPPPPPSPPEYLIRFAWITQVVLGGPREQLLHLLHTSYATAGDSCDGGISVCIISFAIFLMSYNSWTAKYILQVSADGLADQLIGRRGYAGLAYSAYTDRQAMLQWHSSSVRPSIWTKSVRYRSIASRDKLDVIDMPRSLISLQTCAGLRSMGLPLPLPSRWLMLH